MRLFLVLTLTCAAANLVYGAPFAHNEKNDFKDDDKSQQGGGVNVRVYHKLGSIVQLFDVSPNDNGGLDGGNNGDSNGDDGSHKPPSKRSLTDDQSQLVHLHHSKLVISEPSEFTWNHKADDLATIRVAKCTTDVLGEKHNYIEHLAIGHTSWNDVLSEWWGKNEERKKHIKKTLDQSMNQKKSISVDCASQKCPHGPYYACNYIFPSNGPDEKY